MKRWVNARRPLPARKRRAAAPKHAAAPKVARTHCSSRGFCAGLIKVCSLRKANARGGLEISFSASREAKRLKFRERAIVRQDGHKPVIVLNYCPFCGVKYNA